MFFWVLALKKKLENLLGSTLSVVLTICVCSSSRTQNIPLLDSRCIDEIYHPSFIFYLMLSQFFFVFLLASSVGYQNDLKHFDMVIVIRFLHVC